MVCNYYKQEGLSFMEEPLDAGKVIRCLSEIGTILAEMPNSKEKAGMLVAWLEQVDPIILSGLEEAEGLASAFRRAGTGTH